MMSSPLPTLGICLFYAYFSKVLGPKLMENRKPFNLRKTLIIYNFVQTVFSAWIFYEVIAHILSHFSTFSYCYFLFTQYLMSGWWGSYSFRCQPVDYSNNPTALRVSVFVIHNLILNYESSVFVNWQYVAVIELLSNYVLRKWFMIMMDEKKVITAVFSFQFEVVLCLLKEISEITRCLTKRGFVNKNF